MYLGTSVVGYGLALLFVVLRLQFDGNSWGGWLAGFALTQLVVATLAWGRVARLYGLAELALDAKAQAAVTPPARAAAVVTTEAPATA